MAKKLRIDTGVQEYEINGSGLLRINPGDPNLYVRFLDVQPRLAQVERELSEKEAAIRDGGDGEAALRLLAEADKRAKALLQEAFGPENDFDAMLGGVNILAVAGNGERVITNLLAALTPILEAGAEACGKAEADQARANRAARRAPRRRAQMNAWGLPTTAEIAGRLYHMNTDFRDVLEILHKLDDPETPLFLRWRVALALFYDEDVPPADRGEAIRQLTDFVNCGRPTDEAGPPPPKLIDWEQDALLIAADVNRAAGCEVRALPYLHWWTFMAWFSAIGEGQLATVVRLRSKLRKGQKLEKWEREFYRANKARVDLKKRYTAEELAERQRLKALLGE